MLERYVKKILSSRVYDVADQTPLQRARGLSNRLQQEIYLKREDLQPVFSFKIRGAYNKMVLLSEAQQQRGVITASAGNHAQGVAFAANHLGLRATIVMGRNTPSIKIDAVKALGAKVVLQGDTYDEAAEHAHKLAASGGQTYVHPYDDPDTIAGQGTVGMEILNQLQTDIRGIFVPVGGGGLIAGIAAFVKYLQPRTQIIGVEAEGSACLSAALKANKRVKLPYASLDLFADGVSVSQVGKHPFAIAKAHVDQVITVSTDEICAAIKDTYDDTRSISEPAGALAVAGMKKYFAQRRKRATDNPDDTYVAIVSGANVNFDRLRHISERAEVGEQREAVLAVTIDEARGSFRQFCRVLGRRAVTEFNYRFSSTAGAHIYVGLQVADALERKAAVAELKTAGYAVTDMTDNETAKLHVRHMVGGRRAAEKSELLYRFAFPERPGALMQFLTGLGTQWNITMFHYRNHGAAWGRVLVGFEGEGADRRLLSGYLQKIGYRYWEETDNPAYQLFLK